jgi:hypothetical protein
MSTVKRSLPLAAASLHRREFLRLAVVAAVAFASTSTATGCGSGDPPPAETPPPGGSPSLPSLGGAPDTAAGRTIAAFVDTVVPGRHRDPTGAPGAIDVGAAGLFFDPELPAAQFVGVLVVLLNAECQIRTDGRDFADVSPEERDMVLSEILAKDSPVSFAVQLAKLAYFASEGAAKHLGYPGPNAGYVADADFSFGRPMSREITADGNVP